MAKIQPYKLVNPGVSSVTTPAISAAKVQTLALNRLGTTVGSLSSVVSDLGRISTLTVKSKEENEKAKRRSERREKDSSSETKQESAALKKEGANKNSLLGRKIKKGTKGIFGTIEKFLSPLGGLLVKLATFTLGIKLLEYLGDPKNIEKIKLFLDKSLFVFNKLKDFAMSIYNAFTSGLDFIFGKETTIGERLDAFGKIALAIGGISGIIAAAGGIRDLLDARDLLDGPDKPRKPGKPQKPGVKPTVKPTVKPGPKLSPFQLEQARKTATNKTLGEAGEQGSKKATGQVLKYGGKNISKATHRFFLKVIGRGGVKGLKKLIGAFKLPLISGLLTAALNWIMGESIARSLMMGVGDGIGTFLGGWAGGAIGALGGPAAPITIPLGAFVGAMLGGIAGEAIGGYLYDMMLGKANLGADLGAMGKKLVNGMKTLWNDYIMNGDFWAGAWETFLNIGQDVMSSAWGSMMNMWNLASGSAADFFTHMMEVSKPWREAMWDAFQKYVINGPQELAKVIFDTILSGAKGVGKLFTEGGPILMSIIKTSAESAISWAFNKVRGLVEGIRDAVLGFRPREALSKLGSLLVMLGAPLTQVPEMLQSVGKATSKKISEALAKTKEIGQAIIEPILGYIEPAFKAIDETWKIVSNLPGYIYDNTIKPIFDSIGAVWNSGPAIWDFLHRPNTFQEITGQEVPQQEMFLGGVVKGVKNAFSSVGNAVSNVMKSPVGQVLGTAASFIPGAAPIMAGINTLATGNPMSMLGMIPGVSGIMSQVGNFMNGPIGNIASNVLSGNFGGALSTGLGMLNPSIGQFAGSILRGGLNPMNMIQGAASHFGLGGIYNAVTGMMGGDMTSGIAEIAGQLGIDPKVIGGVQNVASQALSEGGMSSEYAMNQALEFIPIPVILEKLVPIPTAVPINTGGSEVVNATPSSLTTRSQ
ncbi:hypothetical protein Np121112_012 [Cyanophage S-RIM12_Np_22_1112]|uniref:Uncharacterized protein n=1 Tax=Cyanophage S-RIM12 TaxID=1278402 RepID=A0A1D7SPL6_9CAUD|nr:hypothetical protein Np121112_012 [Cyanophage S-RIM12_Np_22_1112]AOO17004.1 hypothetical protein RW220110_012 [Cyanophage S-RIM12_RW_22_0110]